MFANVETFFSPFFARKTLANMLDGKDGEEKRKWVNILSHYARICEEFFSLSLPLVIQIVAKVLFKRKFSVKFTVVWWERGSQLRASCTTRDLLLLSARCRNLSSLASSIKIAFKPTFGAFFIHSGKLNSLLGTVPSACSYLLNSITSFVSGSVRSRAQWKKLSYHTFNSQEDTKWVSGNDLNILSRRYWKRS